MASALRSLVAVLAVAGSAAAAQPAYTARAANLRAGPSREFPVVAVLPAGLQVAVQGCLSTYTWCDVVAGVDRGWVWGGNVHYFWQNAFPPVLTWGPVIGVAILDFEVDDYWGRYYRAQPWYPERHRWAPRSAPLPHVPAQPRWAPARPAQPQPGAGPRPVRPPGVVPPPERPQTPSGTRPGHAAPGQRQYP